MVGINKNIFFQEIFCKNNKLKISILYIVPSGIFNAKYSNLKKNFTLLQKAPYSFSILKISMESLQATATYDYETIL